ncbi:hypothetical protein HZB96_00700 [Candidatus Gottesmanbacteria bacterium]|nr:hypothetical protein [Candidatus Gottesmanbacteria bacterium]
MKANNKGFSSILIIILIVVVIVIAGIYLAAKKGAAPSTVVTSSAPMQTTKDLNNASADLDNADVTGLDTQLNQLDSDASSF